MKKNTEILEIENMIFVRGGKYKSLFLNKEREVCDLEVCKYPITQNMWIEIMGNNPSYHIGGRKPVEQISWWDALEFCNEMSKKYHLEPVYNITYDNFDNPILKINQIGGKAVEVNKADFKKTEGFRLPTEIEWEWFSKGGEVAIQDGTFNYTYSGSENIDEVAWYEKNSRNQTHDVGTKKPNQLGLYDCSGNVWEWCYDTDSSGYISEETSYIYDASQDNRRLKGGSWYISASSCTVVIRGSYGGTNRYEGYGFRLVRTI